MKRVLFIAYFFPPIGATGAMRPLNFCRHLPVHGWLPHVLATDHPSALPPQPLDMKLLDRLPREIAVERVPHANPRGRLLQVKAKLDGWRKETARQPELPNRSSEGGVNEAPNPARSVGWISKFASGVAEALFEFPDIQCAWNRPAVRSQVKKDAGERPDVVWATGGPWTSLLIGQRLARQWKVPFIADFRDPWIGNNLASTRFQRKAARLEQSVCEQAVRIILNTEELCEDFRKRYPSMPEKFMALTNGYAPELEAFYDELAQTNRSVSAEGTTQNKPFELCHFGTVYGNRSPIELFRAVEELACEGLLTPAQLRLRFVGAWDVEEPICRGLAKSLEERGILKREPPIPHRQCLEEMAYADSLLILQQNFPLQIPAKIYEYIVAGRPLLVIGGEGATANLVRRNRLGECCPNTVAGIKTMLGKLVGGAHRIQPPLRADVEQFSYRLLSKQLADIFDKVTRAA